MLPTASAPPFLVGGGWGRGVRFYDCDGDYGGDGRFGMDTARYLVAGAA